MCPLNMHHPETWLWSLVHRRWKVFIKMSPLWGARMVETYAEHIYMQGGTDRLVDVGELRVGTELEISLVRADAASSDREPDPTIPLVDAVAR